MHTEMHRIQVAEQRGRLRRALISAVGVAALAFALAPTAASASSEALTWGPNERGQLGNGTTTESTLPAGVCAVGPEFACPAGPLLSGVVAVSGGETASVALLGDGSVVAWGDNTLGELGNGATAEKSDVPVAVGGLSEVTAVAAGGNHALALLRNGKVMAWGYNAFGQLGTGTATGPENCAEIPCSRHPVEVRGLSGVTAIAADQNYSMALLSNGTVVSWGMNQFGELGNGTTTQSDVPVAVSGLSEVTAIAAGDGNSAALLKDGTVRDWGYNGTGGLGDGTETGPESCNPYPCSRIPVAVSGLSGVVAIGDGTAVLSDGTVRDWGVGANGQLGNGTSTSTSDVPVAVSNLTGVTAVAVGFEHRLALLSNGTVMAWGDNNKGQLGVGTTTGPETCLSGCSRIPVAVSNLRGITSIGAGKFFSLAAAAFPLISVTKVEPNHGSPGTTVTITGTGFIGASAVKFGSANAASFTVNSETSITAVSPAAAGAVDVIVTAPDGTSTTSEADRFTYAPTVTKLEPTTGPAAGGTSVTITGTSLTGATAVKFGSNNATSFTVNSETSITALSPAGAGTVDVTVSTPAGASPTAAVDQFSYGPTVTKVEPTTGLLEGGTSVTITGTGLTGATAVKFGPNNATSFTINSETSITAVSPAGTGTVDVTVSTPAGASPTGSVDQFNYQVFPPRSRRAKWKSRRPRQRCAPP